MDRRSDTHHWSPTSIPQAYNDGRIAVPGLLGSSRTSDWAPNGRVGGKEPCGKGSVRTTFNADYDIRYCEIEFIQEESILKTSRLRKNACVLESRLTSSRLTSRLSHDTGSVARPCQIGPDNPYHRPSMSPVTEARCDLEGPTKNRLSTLGPTH